MVGDVLELELHRLAQPLTQPQAGAIRPAVQCVVIVQDDLGPRILALGVRGEEHPQPSRDLVVGPTRKHVVQSTWCWKGGALRAPPPDSVPARAGAAPAALAGSAGLAEPAEEQSD